MRFRLSSIILFFALMFPAFAQENRTYDARIQTLRVRVNGLTGQLPLIRLGSDDHIEISFDDLTHEYERYEYRVRHLNRDWQEEPSLFLSDALRYTQESMPIDDYDYSLNTSQLYTHYQFVLPNVDARPLISGNYVVQISRDGDYENDLMAEVFFMVAEQEVGISAKVSDDTYLDFQREHQQIDMTVDYGGLTPAPRDAREDVTITVLQNLRRDNSKNAVPPSYQFGTRMQWEKHRDMVFEAGNEYRRFEMISTRYPGLGMESMRWYDPYYHAVIAPAERRRNYTNIEDRNGEYVIRTTDDEDSELESEYVFTHFELLMPTPLPEGKHVYVQGQWTTSACDERNEMIWNEEGGFYECAIYLKQGYYSYQYLISDADGVGQTSTIEGNFFQTENRYDILVYYRSPMGRYDRLVGYMHL